MPANIVKSFANKTGKSETEVETLWNKAKEQAKEQGHSEEYDYIVGILKRMLKLNESFRTLLERLNQGNSRLKS